MFFLYVLHVYMWYIGCSSFQVYMCIAIGGILAVLSFSFTCVSVLYWLFFLLVLHVYRCYVGCYSLSFTCVYV